MPTFAIEQRVAEAVAREAGKRMRRDRRGGFDVGLKSKNDLVTDIDRSIEEFVKTELLAAFPGDVIVGEEAGTVGTESGRRWYVDPIDGTMNFVKGIEIFCVSIGLVADGERVVGVIYDPSRDELFSGRRGEPALLDGAPIEVTDVDTVDESVFATGFAPSARSGGHDNLAEFAAVGSRCRGTRRLGSAAIDLAYVACGRLDGFWEFNLSPWDTCAGALLVELAGGVVTSLGSSRYTVGDECIIATNGKMHDELLEILRTA